MKQLIMRFFHLFVCVKLKCCPQHCFPFFSIYKKGGYCLFVVLFRFLSLYGKSFHLSFFYHLVVTFQKIVPAYLYPVLRFTVLALVWMEIARNGASLPIF